MRVLAEKYAQEYFDDIAALGLDIKHIQFPRASDYIPDQISLIQALEEKQEAKRLYLNAKAQRWLARREVKRANPLNMPRTSKKKPRGMRKLHAQRKAIV